MPLGGDREDEGRNCALTVSERKGTSRSSGRREKRMEEALVFPMMGWMNGARTFVTGPTWKAALSFQRRRP